MISFKILSTRLFLKCKGVALITKRVASITKSKARVASITKKEYGFAVIFIKIHKAFKVNI